MRLGRRLLLPLLAATLAAGGLAAAVVGAPAQGATTLTTGTTATTPPPPPPAAPAPGLIADGVTIGGVPVGGLTANQANAAIDHVYLAPVTLTLGQRTFSATTRQLGFHVFTANPLRAAMAVGRVPGAVPRDFPLTSRFAGNGMRRYLRYLDRTFDRPAVDARLVLRHGTPTAIAAVWGRSVDRQRLVPLIGAALRNPARPTVPVPLKVVRPAVGTNTLGPAIVIDRGAHSLTYYNDAKRVRVFGVAVGQPIYPTPTGAFSIVTMQRNPWWYPPNTSWAAGASPIPPGPGNPLGTRWMGLSAPGVGIHGTPDAASIGYSASHGCIRMHIPDAEWLFQHVVVGTPVWIVD
jgi:lipoprotein-anchoring transpeptidase ErfK/SrfK